jgi:hypothetical protein
MTRFPFILAVVAVLALALAVDAAPRGRRAGRRGRGPGAARVRRAVGVRPAAGRVLGARRAGLGLRGATRLRGAALLPVRNLTVRRLAVVPTLRTRSVGLRSRVLLGAARLADLRTFRAPVRTVAFVPVRRVTFVAVPAFSVQRLVFARNVGYSGYSTGSSASYQAAPALIQQETVAAPAAELEQVAAPAVVATTAAAPATCQCSRGTAALAETALPAIDSATMVMLRGLAVSQRQAFLNSRFGASIGGRLFNRHFGVGAGRGVRGGRR